MNHNKNNRIRISLQFFGADNVAANGNDTSTMPEEIKTFYDTELLESAKCEMVYAQLAKRQPLPAHHGKTVEWRKWNAFAPAGKLQ
jgi:N4-gp56 family major capsid protein